MNINSYLSDLASEAIIRNKEKANINLSINTLKDRLNNRFGDRIKEQLIFGSYTRGTILPRSMDSCSDIDYMIVFSDGSFKPQTYLNYLRDFVEKRYNRSEITQSNPTIVLTMNDIRFELVPAIGYNNLHGLRIPAKASEYQDWIPTNPNDFNQQLSSTNQAHNELIKPLVRLVKYWNACNDYPFESFDLEQRIVGFSRVFNPPVTHLLKDYFYSFMETLCQDLSGSQYKQSALSKAKQIIGEASILDYNHHDKAIFTIVKLLPPI